MECKSIDLSFKLSLACKGDVNYYKSVDNPIPTRGNREHPDNFWKQQSRGGVPTKTCSKNMQQIYWKIPMHISCMFSEHLFVATPLNGTPLSSPFK